MKWVVPNDIEIQWIGQSHTSIEEYDMYKLFINYHGDNVRSSSGISFRQFSLASIYISFRLLAYHKIELILIL